MEDSSCLGFPGIGGYPVNILLEETTPEHQCGHSAMIAGPVYKRQGHLVRISPFDWSASLGEQPRHRLRQIPCQLVEARGARESDGVAKQAHFLFEPVGNAVCECTLRDIRQRPPLRDAVNGDPGASGRMLHGAFNEPEAGAKKAFK